ncbi:MAG: leucine-rich repeat protein [Oscillospiraceae bacterium]|nr:leucine-rich repeat protein [Oscillospiraceae bacterium]
MKQRTRLIAMLLAVMTVVQMLPLNVLAAQEKPDEATQTRISQVVQAEPSAQAVQPAAEPEPEIPETEPAAAMTEPDYGVAAVSDDAGFSWTLEEGVLTISGAGEMPWSDTSVPWYGQKDTVTSVVIGDGITRISSAFGTHSALTEVTIADSVTGIQGGAFQECTALREIDLPAGITHLESDIFWGCTALERVGLPAGLTTIDNNVFLDCASLKSIDLPDSIDYIGLSVFENSGLESVRLPKSLQTIYHYTFSGCTSLKSVVIQEGLLGIQNEAFKGCTALESINFPSTLENIYANAFRGCTGLKELTIPAGTHIYSNGYDYSDAFSGCTGITKVTVMDGADSIGGFHGCTALAEVILPDSVTTISEGAFEGCTSLSRINMPTSLEIIGYNAFKNCTGITQVDLPGNLKQLGGLGGTGITEIVIPDTVTHLFDGAFTGCLQLKTVKMSGSLTSTGYSTFSGCTALEHVELPAGVVSIEHYTFKSCASLQEIDIPAGVTSIGMSAFNGAGMKELTLPGKITSFGDYAFSNCANLETVTLGEGLTTLGEKTFSDCINLKTVIFSSTMKDTGSYAFENCSSLETLQLNEGLEHFSGISGCMALKEVTIPSTLTSGSFGGSGLERAIIADGMETIPGSLFYNCELLTQVAIPDSVTAIGASAFAYNTALASIDIPDGVTTIGAGAFQGCTALVAITLPAGLAAIEQETFSYCGALGTIVIPEGVSKIGDRSFSNCKGLTEITIPGSVTSIGYYAFYNCTGLLEVILQDGVQTIDYAFRNCTALTRIEIPASVTSINASAFYNCKDLTIYAVPDSYAWTYAEEHGIPVVNSLLGSNELILTVLGSDGSTLTSGYTVNWYEGDGDEIIASGNTLSGVDTGNMNYEYEILLDEELSYQYYQPVRCAAAELEEIHSLIPIGTVSVAGSVTDADGAALSGAEIEITQTYNGQHTKTISAVTDGSGRFTIQLAAVEITAAVSAQGYFSRTVGMNLELKSGSYDMAAVALSPVSGNKVTLSIQMQGACGSDEMPVYQYVAAEDLTFTVHNISRNQAVTELEYRHPDLLLSKTQVAAGEQIRVTVTDPRGQMPPQSVTLTLDENACGEETIFLVERGGFEISGLAGAERAYVMIFESSGNLRTTVSIDGAYRAENLPAGQYQLVIVQDNDVLRSAANISVLTELGLRSGTDYALKSITVSNGLILDLGTVSVPVLNTAKFCYTVSENTSVTANYQKTYPGKYVMLRLEYEIDPAYQTSGHSLTIELPEHMDLRRDSVTLNGKSVVFSESGNTVKVNTGASSGVVRCYVSSSAVGDYAISSYLGFTLNGTALKQPIGTASLEISAGEITVPERTAMTAITVRGETIPNSDVQVYANDEPVGTTTSNAAGGWSVSIPLNNHYSRSAYEISAVISSEDQDYRTDSKWVLYDAGLAELSSVTMHNTDSHGGHEITVFDFKNPQSLKVYSAYPGIYPTFSFIVTFTGGDDTVIKNVKVITRDTNGRNHTVNCEYTGGNWVGAAQYHTVSDLPVAIGVQYDLVEYNEEPVMDAERTRDAEAAIAEAEKELEDLRTSMTVTDAPDYTTMTNEELLTELESLVAQEDQLAADSDYQIASTLMELNAEIQQQGDSFVVSIGDMGTTMKLRTPETTDHDTLVAEGYTAIASTDGSYVYQKDEGGTVTYVDPVNGILLTAQSTAAASRSGNSGDAFEQLQNAVSTARDWLGNLASFLDAMKDKVDKVYAQQVVNLKSWRQLSWKRQKAAEELERRILRDEILGLDDQEAEANRIRLKHLKSGIKRAESQMNKCWNTLGSWIKAKNLLRGIKFASILYDLAKIADYTNKIITLYQTLKDCPGADALRGELTALAVGAAADLAIMVASYAGGTAALAAAVGASLGSAAVPAILAWIGITVATIAASAAISYFLEKGYNAVLEKAKALGCSSDPDAGPLMRYMTPMVDPSGYVYEAVPSNRLEGVKAEIYYADNGQQILWNAADYEQINPLYTDSDGKYQWDVPFGLWLVKYSKDGYLDADSRNDPAANDDGYLPVPPPQVDVNVGMVSTAAPQVESVNVYQDQVQVIFSQYMKPESLELVVSAGSKQISGTFEAANAEYNYEGTAQYATVFNFTPDAALSGNVTVSVSGAVNYAGTAMESAYSRTKTVVYRPEHITVTQTAPLVYGGTSRLEIQILPAEAGANQTLTVGAPAQGIVDADQQTFTTDAQGKASITLRGTLPGEGPVIVSLDGTDLSAEVIISVTMGQPAACEKVTASIPSGSTVVPGTELTLTTGTPGAKIYYTLDGTCPCVVGSTSRMEYTGPIIIAEETFLIAYAVKAGMEDSATAAFVYSIQPNPFIDVIKKDYYFTPVLWAVSKGITTGLSPTYFGVDENCTRGQFVTFLWRAAGEPEPTTADNPFTDVEPGQFYSKAVLWAVEKGITTGLSPTTFGVNDPCTRAQVVTFLHRFAGKPVPSITDNPFDDVESGQFYSTAILWAVEEGITNGLDANTFGVNVPCNRAQVVTFLYRAIA